MKRFRGKCKWLRPWWVCHGEIYDEVKTMCKAETAKFWWSRAFAGVKSRAMARARGKGKGKVNGPEAKGKGKGTGEVHRLEEDLEDTLEDLEDLEGHIRGLEEDLEALLSQEEAAFPGRPECSLRRGGC